MFDDVYIPLYKLYVAYIIMNMTELTLRNI